MTPAALPRPAPRVGRLPRGPRDAITDVPGVTVGHCTLAEGDVQTGVTVVRPHGGDPYRDRVPAASVVLNGFGKSVGLMQVEELGVLETPIALTNTYAVPAVAAAQIRAAIADNPEIGRALPTLNPLVFECNDGYLNDLQRMAVEASHYHDALDAAGAAVAEGSVGAGRGMSSFGLKGGIGTASRRVRTRAQGRFTLGSLVLSNFGKPSQIRVCGAPLAAQLRVAGGEPESVAEPPEKGSIIMILATDAPLDARQLRRLALRAGAGLARTGSVFGHGSGDIALAFSTAYTVPQDPARPMPAPALLHDAALDPLFEAAADGIEQAIIHALWRAEAVTGRDGHRREALTDLLPGWAGILGA
ncbi:MAG: P1 family peptidase [Microvirga sp.]